VLVGSKNSEAWLWDAVSGESLCEFASGFAAFRPDGGQVVTAVDKTVSLWDAFGRRLRVFEGHKDDVTSVVFSPDGHHLLTGSKDETAILWDARSGDRLRVFDAETSVPSVAFSPRRREIEFSR